MNRKEAVSLAFALFFTIVALLVGLMQEPESRYPRIQLAILIAILAAWCLYGGLTD